MPLRTRNWDVNPIYPAHSPELAVKRPVRLPIGVNLVKGQLLSRPTYVAARSEVVTLSLGGGGTGGTFAVTFTAGGVANQALALPYNVSTAAFKTALETLFGTGNLSVSGTAGSSYVVTFAKMLSNQRFAQNWAVDVTGVTGGTPTGSWAYTTRGSSGEGQYDVYAAAGSGGMDIARAILLYDYRTDQFGGRYTEQGVSGQPFTPPAYFSGYFWCSEITGLDADAITDLNGSLTAGTAYSDPQAILKF